MQNGWVVLKDAEGKSFEFPDERFSVTEQQYLRALASAGRAPAVFETGKPITSARGYQVRSEETISNQVVTLGGISRNYVAQDHDIVVGPLP